MRFEGDTLGVKSKLKTLGFDIKDSYSSIHLKEPKLKMSMFFTLVLVEFAKQGFPVDLNTEMKVVGV